MTRRKFIQFSIATVALTYLNVTGIPSLGEYVSVDPIVYIDGLKIPIMPNSFSCEIQGMVTNALNNSEGIEFKQKDSG